MIKLLLADDEPLVLVGLQSMLKWEEYDIEICATARNGEQTMELIEKYSPDLVIADVRMPLLSGLEVMKRCRETYGRLPLFIVLTSYEEFEYVREAIQCQAVDYLVKLELTPESLSRSVAKALGLLREMKREELGRPAPEERAGMQPFYDRFFVRLMNGLFDSREQYLSQKEELGVDFSFDAYAACFCEILGPGAVGMGAEKQVKLYSSTVQMVRETVTKYMACYITGLDMRHFVITFCLSEQEAPDFCGVLEPVLLQTTAIVRNYFSVRLVCAVGSKTEDPFRLSESFSAARLVFPSAGPENPIVFSGRSETGKDREGVFDLSEYKSSITKAYGELDADALEDLVTRIAGFFRARPARSLQAMDAACSLLYMAISMLPDGEGIVARIFRDEPENYRCLYKKRTAAEIVDWMLRLRDGLCATLRSRRQSYKSRTVKRVQDYIRENLNRKLSLNEVADLFGFSPNYLSQLFAHCAGCSFVEFITREKISAAKEMMAAGNIKIYEIAEKLGFESAFYFSRVFKKAEGRSPREYIRSKQ